MTDDQQPVLETKFDNGDVFQRWPLLGTIKNCALTDFGWRGIMPDGQVIEVRAQNPEFPITHVPEHIVYRRNDKLLGAYLTECKPRQKRKRSRRGGSHERRRHGRHQ